MQALLKRFNYTDKQTLGDLIVFNERNGIEFVCKTLELPWLDNKRRVSCIPEREYTVKKHVSPKFGECFWVQDVEGRSEILIHKGNFAGSKNPRTGKPDILGCILAGVNHIDIDGDGVKDITSSKKTMDRLLEVLPDEFTIRIESA